MSILNLIIGGIEIPFESSHVINQSYSPLGASNVLRMADGSGFKQTAWFGKTKIETSGTGKLPLPLRGLDYESQIVMECVEPLTEYSASNVITLPTARRSDVSILGFATVSGRAVKSAVSISGDVATVTSVANATGYHVIYYPKFTVFLSRPNEDDTARSLSSRSWSIEAVEV